MTSNPLGILGLCFLNVAVALLVSPFFEGILRKLKAALHSRMGPPITQPFLDILKLLGKEDLRTARGALYGAAPALSLASVLLLATLVPMGAAPPWGSQGTSWSSSMWPPSAAFS
jgi:formate hydrogenlyase subunit 4